MPDQKRMDKVNKELEKISYLMQRFENTAREEISSREDRNMYVEILGPIDAARLFEALAQTFHYQEDMLNMFQGIEEKPTIH